MDLIEGVDASVNFKEGIFASVLLITYNQEEYAEGALLSILNQDYENIEIIVSDDCSNDSTWMILKQVVKSYHGTKKVILNRNASTKGILGNRLKAFSLSRGKLIFFADGDDISLKQRCSKSIDYWMKSEVKYDLIASDGFDMTKSGQILGVKHTDNLENFTLKDWAKRRPYFFGASFMVTRDLLDSNVFDFRLKDDDHSYVFRAIIRNGAARLPSSLIMHRRGGISQPEKNKTKVRRESKKDSAKNYYKNKLIEYYQFLNDANKFNRSDEFVKLHEHQLKYSEYTINILTAEGLFAKLHCFYNYSSIAFWKRIRYLKYALFYN